MLVSEDHYFSANPASSSERRPLTVTLAGQDVALESAGGIFSPARIDLGTSVLLRNAPAPPAGNLLDVGCGWGPIALTMALLAPDAHVWAVDVNERALDLTRRNADTLARTFPMAQITAATPADVPEDLAFDAMWSNPPIRVGKEALHGILATWLPRMKANAHAHLVVQRNLGADSLVPWVANQRDAAGAPWGTIEKLKSSKGFRVLRFTRSPGTL